jgi:hypothetical protein
MAQLMKKHDEQFDRHQNNGMPEENAQDNQCRQRDIAIRLHLVFVSFHEEIYSAGAAIASRDLSRHVFLHELTTGYVSRARQESDIIHSAGQNTEARNDCVWLHSAHFVILGLRAWRRGYHAPHRYRICADCFQISIGTSCLGPIENKGRSLPGAGAERMDQISLDAV